MKKKLKRTVLNIGGRSLYKWRRKYEFNNSDPNRSIEAELSRLRKENSELRQERDILKKSVAIFIKPQK